MKDKAIAMGVEMLGEGGNQTATKEWEKMKSSLFGGAEPKPAALVHFGEEDLKKAGVMLVFAKAWSKLFSGATQGLTPGAPTNVSEEDTSAGFRAKRAKKYGAIALATFYATTNNDPDLNAEIDRRTGGEPWVIAVDGKVLAKESALFIDWHANGDEPPAGVVVAGVKVKPVKRGEEKVAKKFREDPSALGHRLPVDFVSKVTGCNFTDVSDECCQFFRVALSYELRGEGLIGKRRIARDMVGKKPSDFADTLPDAFDAYEKQCKAKTLPSLLISEEVVPSDLRQYRDNLPPHRGTDAGFLAAGGDKGNPSGRGSVPVHIPTEAQIRTVHNVLVNLSTLSRSVLLTGINPSVAAGLPIENSPRSQLLRDLFSLRDMGQLTDGTYPIRQYIENAVHLLSPRVEAAKLQACLSPE